MKLLRSSGFLGVAVAILCIAGLSGIGCAPGEVRSGLPQRFQNIKLGMTSAELSALTEDEAEQRDKTTMRIASPTDKIEYIDCKFNKSGSYLYQLVITHFMTDDTGDYDRFIRKCIKKYGPVTARKKIQPKRKREKPVLYTFWKSRTILYEVFGHYYGAGDDKMVITEKITDVGYLEKVKQEELNAEYRDKRRMIESGDF